ncbi:MAG: T9SS C-terminal target domain-containing protein, partial [Panacagrimonas sp.]
MNQYLRRIAGPAVVAALLSVGVTLSSQQAPPVNVPGIDKPVVVVTGEITGTDTWVNTNYYVLRGAVFVRDGGTLDIQAGTRIVGESGSVGTLIILQGGRINAIGTREQPIVFTSDQPIGQRGRGDWGGIIINGRAPINFEGGEASGEGDTGVYGGTDPNDNS